MARATTLVVAVMIGSAARGADCDPAVQDLPAVGKGFVAPAGATAIRRFEVKDQASGAWRATSDLPFPAPAALDANQRDRFASGLGSAESLSAVWSVGTGECRQVIRAAAGPRRNVTETSKGGAEAVRSPPPSGLSEEECPSTAPGPGDALANCQRCAAAWRKRLDRELGGPRYSLAVFTEQGDACLVQNGAVGEPIAFGIYSEESTQWDALRLDPCSIEPETPAVFVSTPGLQLEGKREEETFYLRRYPTRRCFNTLVNVRVTGKKGTTPLLIEHPLQQSQRYRATLQVGAVFTRQHLHSFALRPSGTGSGTVIYDQGPTGRGTEYQATLVLYALPRSLLSIVGTPYPGRDLVHDQGVLDRLGGLLGVSLSDPSRRFYAGLAFEVLYGINVTWGIELFRGRELAGVAVGDAFSASDGAIPTRERWDWDKVWGVSIDLMYVKNLWGGRTPQ